MGDQIDTDIFNMGMRAFQSMQDTISSLKQVVKEHESKLEEHKECATKLKDYENTVKSYEDRLEVIDEDEKKKRERLYMILKKHCCSRKKAEYKLQQLTKKYEEEVAKMETLKEEWIVKLGKIVAENDSLKKSNEEQVDTLREKENKVQALENTLESLNKEMQDMKDASSQMENEIKKLEKTIDILKKEEDSIRNDKEEKDRIKLAEVKESLKQLSKEYVSLQQQFDEKVTHIMALGKHKEKLYRCLIKKKKMVARLYNKFMEEKKLKKAENMEMAENQEPEALNESKRKEPKDDPEPINSNKINEELISLREENQQLKKDFESAVEKLSAAMSENKKLEKDLESAEEKLSAAFSENEKLEKDLQSAEEKLSAALRENKKLEEDLESAEEKLSAAMSESKKLEKDLQSAEEKLSAALSENEKLEKDLESAEEKLSAALSENEKLEKDLESAEEKLSAALSENEKLEDELSCVSQRDEQDDYEVSKETCNRCCQTNFSESSVGQEVVVEASTSHRNNPDGGCSTSQAKAPIPSGSSLSWAQVPRGIDIAVFIPFHGRGKISFGNSDNTRKPGSKRKCGIPSYEPKRKIYRKNNDSSSNSPDDKMSNLDTSSDSYISFASLSSGDEMLNLDFSEKDIMVEEQVLVSNTKSDLARCISDLRAFDMGPVKDSEVEDLRKLFNNALKILLKCGEKEHIIENIMTYLLERSTPISFDPSKRDLLGFTEKFIAKGFWKCSPSGRYGLCEGFIKKFKEKLQTYKNLTLNACGSACMMCAAMCREANDRESIKMLFFKLVRLQKDIVPFLFACIFIMYPESKNFSDQGYVHCWTERVIANILSKKPLEMSDSNWKECRSVFRDDCLLADKSKEKPEDLLNEIQSNIKAKSCESLFSRSMMEDYTNALLLLCLYHGKEWTQEQLLEKYIYPFKRTFKGTKAEKKYRGALALIDLLELKLSENMNIKRRKYGAPPYNSKTGEF